MFDRTSRSIVRTRPAAASMLATVSLAALIALGLAACDKADQAGTPFDPFHGEATANAKGDREPAKPATGDDALAVQADDFASRVEQAAEAQPTADRPAAANQPVGEVDWTTPLGTQVDSRRPAATTANAAAAPEPAPAVVETPATPAPPPAPQPKPLNTAELVQQLAEKLRADGRTGGQFRPYLAAAALTLADPSRELTGDDLASLDTEDRRLLLAYQRAFTQLARSLGENPTADRQEMQVAAEELAEQVGVEKKLRLRNAQLCRKVTGFGQYAAFERAVFLAGRENPAIVYAEIDHFQPEPKDDGGYDVKLTQEIVLYNESDGLAVWKVRPQTVVDHSANRRRDFFVVQIINLPDRLTVGKYLLKLTVTDDVGQQVDEATIPVEVVADRQIASP